MRIWEKTLAVLLVLSLVMNVLLLAVVFVPGDGLAPATSGSGEATVGPATAAVPSSVERAAGAGTAAMQAPVVLQKIEPGGNGPFLYREMTEEGAMVTVSVEIVPGRGRVLVQTTPLMGVVFQDTANQAVAFAVNRSHADISGSDVIFGIQGPEDVSEIDGPSAGALMAALLLSVLEGFPLNESVAVTGTLGEDGSIGPVGGILEKAEAASAGGKTLLVLPEGNERMVEYREEARSPGWPLIVRQRPVVVDAREFIEENFGIRVEYADSIDDLIGEIRASDGLPAADLKRSP